MKKKSNNSIYKLTTLEELAQNGTDKFTDGPFGSRLKVSDYTDSGIPIIRLQNIGESKFFNKNWKYTSQKKYTELIRHSAQPGDVIIAKMAEPVARATIIPPIFKKYLIAADCVKLRIDEEKAIPKFVSYMINSPAVRKRAIDDSQGMTRLRINLREIKKLEIVLPPLPIQKKIVQKLDHTLGQLEEKKKEILELKKKLEKNFSEIPPSFKNRIESKNNLFLIIKNKILENAFDGKLSAEDRKNKIKYEQDWFRKIEIQRSLLLNKNKNKIKKRDVFQILDKADPSLPRIPSEWIWTNIASLETMVGSGSTPKGGKSNYVENGIPFIRSQNVLFNELDLSDVVYISEEIHSKMNRTHVKPNDVLLNITGASIGRASSVPTDFKNGNVNQHVCIIRTGSWMNSDYLSFWLTSPYIQNFIYGIEVGGTKEGLNFEQVRTFPIPLPKIEEQNIIVKQIQSKLSELDLIKTQTGNAKKFYQLSMNDLEKISKSVLNSAFSGKLVN